MHAKRKKRLLGFPSDHQVHGCEKLLLTTGNQTVSCKGKTVGCLLGTPRHKPDLLHGAHESVHESTTDTSHTQHSQEIPHSLHLLEVTRKRVIPGNGIGTISQILMMQQLESSGLDSIQTLGDFDHVGDTVSLLNTQSDFAMFWILVVVFVGHQPFVNTKDTAGLQDTADFAIHALEAGRVNGSLDSIDGVEAVVREGHLHKVTLLESEFVGETLAFGVAGGALDLVVVVVEADDVDAGKFDNLASGTADTAADIEHFHAFLEAHGVSEVVLVTGDGLTEGFAVCEAAEVEGGSPSVFVQVGREVVVTISIVSTVNYSCLCIGRLTGESR